MIKEKTHFCVTTYNKHHYDQPTIIKNLICETYAH